MLLEFLIFATSIKLLPQGQKRTRVINTKPYINDVFTLFEISTSRQNKKCTNKQHIAKFGKRGTKSTRGTSKLLNRKSTDRAMA